MKDWGPGLNRSHVGAGADVTFEAETEVVRPDMGLMAVGSFCARLGIGQQPLSGLFFL